MFKTMTGCLNPKQNPSDEEIRKIPSYIFCQWLSGNPYTITAANQINLFFNIPIECQYKMIKTVFAGRIKYIPYIKAGTEENLKLEEYVQEHYKISPNKVKEYISFMSEEEKNTINEMYTDSSLRKK